MKLNTTTKKEKVYTHQGARAVRVSPELELRRSVMATMLWEDQFYEDGQTIADRISSLVKKVKPELVAAMAVMARQDMKLRHIPLLLVREMARLDSHKYLVADTLKNVIQRPDELTEFLAIYWKNSKETLSAQVKKGLASAISKFNEFQLAKYNISNNIKLRDILLSKKKN